MLVVLPLTSLAVISPLLRVRGYQNNVLQQRRQGLILAPTAPSYGLHCFRSVVVALVLAIPMLAHKAGQVHSGPVVVVAVQASQRAAQAGAAAMASW